MDIYYYKHNNKILISLEKYNFIEITEEEAKNHRGKLFALTKIDPAVSRRSFNVSSPSHLFLKKESLDLLLEKTPEISLPSWLEKSINEGNVMSINTNYPSWKTLLNDIAFNEKSVVSIAGLGDVGGILTSGLRLMGADSISRINIYDKDADRIKRWELECNSILSPNNNLNYPEVFGLKEETEIFNCDIFVFCISVGVPELGLEETDVRLAQLQGNSKIVSHYAKLARDANFNGIFAIVSDPVDLLCRVAFLESNKNAQEEIDYLGLCPEQIKGYGLGVMYARAAYYSKGIGEKNMFLREGRAFGPHGEGLIIANSIENYNDDDSIYLTDKTRQSNLEVRATGFKPYIAPALSSGCLSIIATLEGTWHYSSNFIGGTFLGCKNRETNSGIEIETGNIPNALFKKINSTYNYLKNYSL